MGSVDELSLWSTDRSHSHSWSGSTSQHCYDPTVGETWRANWTHSSTDTGVYICWFFNVYLARGKMRQCCNEICLLNLVFKYFFRNSCGRWMLFLSLVLFSISAQCGNNTTSIISLKFYKYNLSSSLFSFSLSRLRGSLLSTVLYTIIDILRNSPLRRAYNVFAVMQSGIMRIQFSILFVHKLIRKAQARIQSLSYKPENTGY